MSEDLNNDKEPSHALPVRYYRNPLDVVIANEGGTCKGCEHESTILGTTVCTKGKRHGKRCGKYAERPGLTRVKPCL